MKHDIKTCPCLACATKSYNAWAKRTRRCADCASSRVNGLLVHEHGCPNGHHALPVDVSWIDDNDGCGPRKLSASVRVF
jgi:hypothetical protein